MPTGSQDKQFSEEMEGCVNISVSSAGLDTAIDWIAKNLSPEDVFSSKDLEAWAESNGYVKE